ncbi:MAG TPA: trypsin-like peptidase domain-containing protein [Candidatus Polarisedimenticolia bacterium]|jgi:S1-C subfamily serine protease|nr:trypsin-like peptidase domain-containing protein [Candidatus Polarisedimenticolia bacterium]
MRGPAAKALILASLPAVLAAGRSAAPPPATNPVRIERSVVRLINYSQRGDWFSPWEVTQVSELSGSGFVVAGGAIMTNAHVVSDSRLLLVFLDHDPTPYPATVAHIAHDCDLALVRPREAGLLKSVPVLPIGGLPFPGSMVETFGYPTGGTQKSVTRGIVSRIDDQVYQHSGIDSHLTVQTDAAINPGNSGGPVVQDGRVVGVAFQAVEDLENVGYMIPTEVVQRFLRDIADGRYDGYPDLGVRTAGMENPAARRKAEMADGESGVRVDAVDPKGSSDGLLREGDVILKVDGRAVANDGTVEDGEQRIPFGLLADRRQAGEPVILRVLSRGQRADVTVPLTLYPPHRTHANSYDVLPRYYVYAGLVFVPLEKETLKTFGEKWYEQGDKLLLHAFFEQPIEEPGLLLRERVVLLRRLDHPVNGGMAWFRNAVVERVNGRAINRLEDLIAAVESNQGDFHVIELAHHRRLSVLDRKAADEANADILRQYGIAKDRRL